MVCFRHREKPFTVILANAEGEHATSFKALLIRLGTWSDHLLSGAAEGREELQSRQESLDPSVLQPSASLVEVARQSRSS